MGIIRGPEEEELPEDTADVAFSVGRILTGVSTAEEERERLEKDEEE